MPVVKNLTELKGRGKLTELPEITLRHPTGPNDDFQRLVAAFNSLSKRIQEQIDDLRSERNEKEAILESLGEGVIAVNENLKVLYINFIACKMLGVVRRNVLDKSLFIEGENRDTGCIAYRLETGNIVIQHPS